jgi:hypothetical protein
MYVKTTTSFSHFQFVYGLEAVFPIECQSLSLKLAVQLLPDTSPLEERLLYLEWLNEKCHDVALANDAHKKKVKSMNRIRTPRGNQIQTHVVQTFHRKIDSKKGHLSSGRL